MDRTYSIIVPVYNIEKYIEECINSIKVQSYDKWELILVDDGSTDGSGEICKNYASDDSRITYYYKENSGQSDARNLGVTKATGDYLLFVDGDDYISECALENVHKSCIDYNGPAVILSDGMSEFNESTGEQWVGNVLEASKYQGITGYDALMRGIDGELTWSPCGKAYKREHWIINNFYFPGGRISEDFTLIPKVILKASKVACVPNFYTYRRFRMGSSASYSVKKMVRDDIKAFDEWEEYFKKENINKELVDKFRIRFLSLYCHDTMAYLFLFKNNEKKEIIGDLIRYRYLFNYAHCYEEKIIYFLVKIFGFRTTCWMIGLIKKEKLKRIKVEL